MSTADDAGAPRDLESEPISGVMSQGVVACAASMPLADVAARMESERIHCVLVHPDDATARGIDDGSPVRIHNDLGEVVCEARVSDSVRRGVVSIPKGAWSRSSMNGSTSTALSPDDLQSVGNGACFNDARVEVEAAPSG